MQSVAAPSSLELLALDKRQLASQHNTAMHGNLYLMSRSPLLLLTHGLLGNAMRMSPAAHGH
jgi:hypothetical protein